MLGLADCENKNKALLAWLMFWNHWTHTATFGKKLQANENLETLVNKPKQELQRDLKTQGQI